MLSPEELLLANLEVVKRACRRVAGQYGQFVSGPWDRQTVKMLESEDLVVLILERRAKFNGNSAGELYNWVMKVAHNHCEDLRKRTPIDKMESLDDEERHASTEATTDSEPYPSSLWEQEFRSGFADYISGLSKRSRVLLLLSLLPTAWHFSEVRKILLESSESLLRTHGRELSEVLDALALKYEDKWTLSPKEIIPLFNPPPPTEGALYTELCRARRRAQDGLAMRGFNMVPRRRRK